MDHAGLAASGTHIRRAVVVALRASPSYRWEVPPALSSSALRLHVPPATAGWCPLTSLPDPA
ncbi:hypothetical protein SSPO_039130 [Streptomyces antimycoticus]|uniref:Uncharacterized protein n=1 Tax=Streptomyces antimycoticus TaxID=68175 RepID=A0A499UHI2_9ACTN|nr:hypothetical protein SSPO_039130 [Streptomyces antimycoticus]